MEVIEQYLNQIFAYFFNNWIAAAILAAVVLLAAWKKPKQLFGVVALTALLVATLYLMIYLEKSMFSGVSNRERAADIERKAR